MAEKSPENQPGGEIAVHRADQAYALRRQGKSLSDVALLSGYPSGAAVSQAISDRFSQLARAITTIERDNILLMELDRLDELQAAHYESAMYGDIKSGEFVLRVMQHRAKLCKLDQPEADASQNTVLIVGKAESSYVEQLKVLVEKPDGAHGEG